MPEQGDFSVSLIAGGDTLREVYDSVSKRQYAVCKAGDEYKIRMKASGEKHVGAIIQIDGVPAEKDFSRSPFTYFKKPYDDPGFWIEPKAGKYTPRIFSQPKTTDDERDFTDTLDLVGRIRVYFFEVQQAAVDSSAAKRYSTPAPSQVGEGKKWFVAGNTTRYGDTKSTASKGGKFSIVDRKNWYTYVEVWYKDRPSMELMGWDGKAHVTELLMPAVRAKRKAEAAAAEARKRGRVVEDGGVVADEPEPKKDKVFIDLTLDD